MRWIERNLLWIIVALGVGLFLYGLVQFSLSMPPTKIVWLAGRKGGAYYTGAEAYQELARERGFDIQIVETAGAVQALQLLEEGEGDVAFVQGGIAAEADPEKVSALASVAYEPLWIFYRKELAGAAPLDALDQLRGKRIAIGEANSGTNQLAKLLLQDTGLDADNATLLELPSGDAAAGPSKWRDRCRPFCEQRCLAYDSRAAAGSQPGFDEPALCQCAGAPPPLSEYRRAAARHLSDRSRCACPQRRAAEHARST